LIGPFNAWTKSLFGSIVLSNKITILITDFQSMIYGEGLLERKGFRRGNGGRDSEGFLFPH
jgi:hypothetical protein